MSIAARRLQRASKSQPTGLTVTPSSIWGAGFQNAGDKADSSIPGMAAGALIIGADVAGTHTSITGGDSWVKSNTDFRGTNDDRLSSVRWSPSLPNVVYAYSSTADGTGSGSKIKRGTFNPSLGWVTNWSLICNMPRGSQAGNTPQETGSTGGHPRQTGRKMLAIDEVNGFIYAGSVNGVYRIPIGNNTTPVQIALNGSWVTSVSLDPSDSTVLFATSDGGTTRGVHRITGIRGSASVATYRNAGTVGDFPQACVAILEGSVTAVYVANGKTDLYKWNGGGSFTSGWANITNNLNSDEPNPATTTRWSGLDARRYAGSSFTKIIVTDSWQGGANRTGGQVGWSTDGGATWTKVNSSRADYHINNASGPLWWLSQKNASLMIDRGVFDSVNPVLDPNNSSTMYVMGRGGVWRTVNNGTMWYPIIQGTSVTTAHVIRCLPSNPNKVLVADTDWTSMQSSDGFVTQPQSRSPGGVGWNLAVANDESLIVLCTGERDANASGAVHTSPDPWSSSSVWTNQLATGTWSATGTNLQTSKPRCVGAALGTTGSGTPLLFAAFQGYGIYKKTGLGAGGVWTNVTLPNATNMANKVKCHFAWPGDGNTIWMIDPNSGVYQSINRGTSWIRRTTLSITDTSYGQLRHDPTASGRYYFTTKSGVFIVTNGNTGSPSIVNISGPISEPTTLAIHPTKGYIIVAEASDSPKNTRLWVSRDQGANWDDITTDQWRAVGNNPRYMDWGANGKLYTALFAGYVVLTGIE